MLFLIISSEKTYTGTKDYTQNSLYTECILIKANIFDCTLIHCKVFKSSALIKFDLFDNHKSLKDKFIKFPKQLNHFLFIFWYHIYVKKNSLAERS